MSLEEAKSCALLQNREIKQAVLEVNKKEAARKAIITQCAPKILAIAFAGQQVTQGGGKFPENIAVLPGVFQPLTQQYRLLMQVRQASLELESARQSLRLTKQRVVAQVKTAFLTAVALKGAIVSREQNLAFLNELNNYVSAQVRHGAALPVDALQSEAQVAQAEYELERDRDELITLGQTINRILGREVLATIDFANPGLVPVISPDKDRAISEALVKRPELKQLNLFARSSKLSDKIELSRYIPDISVGATGIFSRNLDITLPKSFLSVGFLATWEPWDWGRRIFVGQESERAMRQSQVALSDKKDAVVVEVDNARRALAVAEKQVRAASLKTASTNEELRVLTKRYQFGASLFKDVVETQSAYSKAISDKVTADAKYATVQVELDKALGRDFN